ncbi:MAG: TIGR03936 family radical SAM-associated protein [Clostridia bacterium]
MDAVTRVKFQRLESTRYTSHLETMKVFQRALRRTTLEPAYSEGFNPQMKMVFGLPLQVGVVSLGEYADLSFAREYAPMEVLERLNGALPEGFRVVAAGERTIRKNIMADVAGALYEITYDMDALEMISFIQESAHLPVIKKSKNTLKEVDAKPFILRMERIGKDSLAFLLKAGQVNLNTNTLTEALRRNLGKDLNLLALKRVDLFVERKGILVDALSEEALATEES